VGGWHNKHLAIVGASLLANAVYQAQFGILTQRCRVQARSQRD
jgi:hypothetical protein